MSDQTELRTAIKNIKLPSNEVYSLHSGMRVMDLVDTSLEDQIFSLVQAEILAARKDLPEKTDEPCYDCGRLMFWYDDAYRCIYDGFHNSYSLKDTK